MGIKVKQRMTPEGEAFLKMLEQTKTKRLKVGYFEGENREANGTDVCVVAAKNEFGGYSLPPRPFMRDAVEMNRDTIADEMKEAFRSSIETQSIDESMLKVGESIKGMIQNQILEGGYPGDDTPLIESGTMYESVSAKYEEQ